ncbi:MAG: 16S rRNA (guanine(966)-N(2))-methyltransferase RsmD [Phycisphaerae bacterium]|nr:16S rRNA (guanine(966)-N(2))-methyltransferase RsmD [Phycisphaerae bacterium]MCZ2401502.1 16S rRNA (guanine(966)-N(2))-methyltransferase RsmD [Phycisphaerae bacterium]NUQ49420.1 16S rRNA (guanine(966)-N(2))-methyltransferase RsmD [Phycisphaerae bacterium]
MRVIAGEFRGATLLAPPGRDTRPITDQVKESLFNILGHRFQTLGRLPAVDVLDLFAGSGAIGIECLSRGAASCTFVEVGREALRALRANLEKLRLSPPTACVRSANAWTMRLEAPTASGFGLIFADPPYADVEPRRVCDLFERLAPRLAVDGVLVFRHGSATDFGRRAHRELRQADQRVFGKMRVELFVRSPRAAASNCGDPPPHIAE